MNVESKEVASRSRVCALKLSVEEFLKLVKSDSIVAGNELMVHRD